jgi:nicotinamide riboside transporter PnuC
MELWSWVLAAIGVTGMFFVGKKTVWGWLILLVNECIWIAYALATKQYGFIVMALAYAAVYIKSYIHWRREENTVKVNITKGADAALFPRVKDRLEQRKALNEMRKLEVELGMLDKES